MIGAHIRAVWPGAELVAYQASLNGRVYSTSWIALRGETAPGVYTFVSHLELDPEAMGQGGSRLYATSELEVDSTLRPLRYVTRARGAVLIFEWQGDTIVATLPDGSTQKVTSSEVVNVVEAHFYGLEAVMIAKLHAGGELERLAQPGDVARTSLFLINQLAVIPYQLTAATDLGTPDNGRWYRSSFHEELLIGPEGQLLITRSPMQGIEARRLPEAPPLPNVEVATRAFIPARYTPPADAGFHLEDVSIPGPVTPLGATLTVPKGEAGRRFPAVLFISGSGTHDRNGIIGELDLGTHEIVDSLANAGFVGLRYDTRGAGNTQLGSDALESGLQTIIDDARAAFAFLLARPEVDLERVFLIGHSQGGTVALALATRYDAKVRGVVLLATIGRTMEEISIDQLVSHGRHTGLSEDQINKQVALTREMYELLRSGCEWKAGVVPDVHMPAIRSVPWLREWLNYGSQEMVAKLRCPLLIANGEKDFQVDVEKDAALLYATAQHAAVPAEFHRYPMLDHLFMPTSGDSTLASYFKPGRHVDAQFLADLATWLHAHSDSSDGAASAAKLAK